MRIIELDKTDSTNEYCKRVDDGEDIIVIARRQTGGRGTKGRSFSSEEGGAYISIMRHFLSFPAENAFKIMVNSCVAVCKTLEEFGISSVIRWANDVLCSGLKISGTLIENVAARGFITRSIVGVGLNVNNPLPSELKCIATSMKEVLKKEQNIHKVTSVLVENLQKEYDIESYKHFMPWLGGEISLKTFNGVKNCHAIDVAGDGALVCIIDGKRVEVNSAEVSLRLKDD